MRTEALHLTLMEAYIKKDDRDYHGRAKVGGKMSQDAFIRMTGETAVKVYPK